MYAHRMNVLRLAFQRFAPDKAYETFVEQNRSWLEDYALFTALKDTLGGKPWLDWPEALRLRKADALAEKRRELSEEIRLQFFAQYEFDKQWKALRSYANAKGVRIIGDVPIYVPLDSADVWANPELFQLDESRHPEQVAAARRIPSPQTASSGATPFTTGKRWRRPAIPGGFSAWLPPGSCTTLSAWIISAALRATGRCRQGIPQPGTASG